jgi:hypothetical protein
LDRAGNAQRRRRFHSRQPNGLAMFGWMQVARWHAGGDDRELHVTLGMTRAEYARWVANPSSITEIVASHALRHAVPA